MREMPWMVAVALAGLGAIGCSAGDPALKEPAPSTSRVGVQFNVVAVVDGDTIKVEESGGDIITVRLIGVDTPETVHPQKPVEEYGREASTFLKNLLAGERVRLEYEGSSPAADKYGRTLAYVFRASDGLFANLEIVRQGYGHAYTRYPFRRMEEFRAAEVLAREQHRGLWASESASLTRSPAPAKTATSPQFPQSEPPAVTVFVTKTGAKYHRSGCRYLSKSSIPMDLGAAKARYSPCTVCRPPS